jgi:hypothetical protein
MGMWECASVRVCECGSVRVWGCPQLTGFIDNRMLFDFFCICMKPAISVQCVP